MLDVLLFVVGFVLGVVVGARHRQVIARYVAREVQAVQVSLDAPVDGPACAVCGKPANVVRFHDGRYLCPFCKASA